MWILFFILFIDKTMMNNKSRISRNMEYEIYKGMYMKYEIYRGMYEPHCTSNCAIGIYPTPPI
jgi:hypothetical protein